jgi:cyclopropane-fatty-acyl-phospholipid synthase
LPKVFSNKKFDKIVSIEMIEAVGREFLQEYFDICHQMLHPTRGIMVFQCITMPETRYDTYCKGSDFIQQYIFPGGHCPSVTELGISTRY